MYKLKLASTDKEILEFENLRSQVFDKGKTIDSIKDATYAKYIKSGDALAFRCLKEEKLVGGLLILLDDDNINIHRLFVDKKERGQGAGSFMLDYVIKHKEFFEDYYATDINGIIIEPLDTSIDYYFDKGFDYSGYQMFKKY